MGKAWVCKFGGTSLANASQIEKVKEIIVSNPLRRFVVVSAPGKQSCTDTKITDLLLDCHALIRAHKPFDPLFKKIKARFLEIAAKLDSRIDIEGELAEIYARLPSEEKSDYAASRGEYLNALLLSEYLGGEFVDASTIIHLDSQGKVDPVSYSLIAEKLVDDHKLYVIPGFYGLDESGAVKTFSRGGSDITGAVVANGVKAELYENWSDVSGIYMADPRLVTKAPVVPHLTYHELALMAQLGASVFHQDAIEPVVQPAIPIRVKNTDDPQAPGSLITARRDVKKQPLVGITGKKVTNVAELPTYRGLDVGVKWPESSIIGIIGEGWPLVKRAFRQLTKALVVEEIAFLIVTDEPLDHLLLEVPQPKYKKAIEILLGVAQGVVNTTFTVQPTIY